MLRTSTASGGRNRARRATWRCAECFVVSGWAKEAHYRQAWPIIGESNADAVGYAILRSDWASAPMRRMRAYETQPGTGRSPPDTRALSRAARTGAEPLVAN